MYQKNIKLKSTGIDEEGITYFNYIIKNYLSNLCYLSLNFQKFKNI